MKTLIFALFLVALMVCCKSSDPSPTATGGCTVQFKGVTHTLSIAICSDGSLAGLPTVDGLSAAETTGSKSLVIARDSADPASNSVTFMQGSATGDTYIAAEGITSQPNITRSGKSWTFSGTASNGTESVAITGNCTCSN